MVGLGLIDRPGGHRALESVGPGAGGFGQQVLDTGFVGFGDVDALRIGPVRHLDGEMHQRPRRFTDARGIVDANTAELSNQDVLHLESDEGRVAVTGQVDQAGHEMAELVATNEQQRAPPRAQVDNGHRHIAEFLCRQREQLRARHGLDDVEE